MARRRPARVLPLLRGPRQWMGARVLPPPDRASLATLALPPQPDRPLQLGSDARTRSDLAADTTHPASLPISTSVRHHLRQEPSAVIPLAGICGGGHGQPRFLLRRLPSPSAPGFLQGRQAPGGSSEHSPLVRGGDVQRLAVLRDRAARDRDALLLLQELGQLVVRERVLRVLLLDQLLDALLDRGLAGLLAGGVGGAAGEEVAQAQDAVRGLGVLARDRAADGGD